MLMIGIIVGAIVCWLWYWTTWGVWISLVFFGLFLVFAIFGKVGAQRTVISLKSSRFRNFDIETFQYLHKHAQFFLFPSVSHMQAVTATGFCLSLMVLCLVLLLEGRWLDVFLAIILLSGLFWIAGTWNHPYQVARRVHLREKDENYLSSYLERVRKGNFTKTGEEREKELYDTIIREITS